MGKLFPVHSPGVEVFAASPRPPPLGDALSLAALAPANPRPSEATLRTREKIGLGETSLSLPLFPLSPSSSSPLLSPSLPPLPSLWSQQQQQQSYCH